MRDSQPNYNKWHLMEGPYLKYNYLEITVSGGVSDFDVRENTTFFDDIVHGEHLEVSSSGSDVYLKMNGSGNAPIRVADGADWAVSDFLFTNLYLSNDSVSDAVVSIYAMSHR